MHQLLLLGVIVVTVAALTTYVAPLLSIVTALVTKSGSPPTVKALVTLGLSIISALVTTAIATGDGISLDNKFLTALVWTFLLAIASYYGLWKPTGIAAKAAALTGNAKLAIGKAPAVNPYAPDGGNAPDVKNTPQAPPEQPPVPSGVPGAITPDQGSNQ